jgi:hypothetical protein
MARYGASDSLDNVSVVAVKLDSAVGTPGKSPFRQSCSVPLPSQSTFHLAVNSEIHSEGIDLTVQILTVLQAEIYMIASDNALESSPNSLDFGERHKFGQGCPWAVN